MVVTGPQRGTGGAGDGAWVVSDPQCQGALGLAPVMSRSPASGPASPARCLGSLLWPAGEKLVVIGGRGAVDTISGAACGLAVVDARRHFQCEYPSTWPQEVLAKFVTQEEIAESAQLTTRAERDALLAECVIAVVSWPYPLDLRSRCPKLRWVHSVNAGVSNFRSPFEGKASDVWGSGVKLTSSRGSNFALPIAEYALGCIFLAGKCFAQAWRDKQGGAFERTRYRPVLIRGKTLGIIGHGTP